MRHVRRVLRREDAQGHGALSPSAPFTTANRWGSVPTMLEFLRIRDLALIDDLELEFGPGLNALTGETGAGKSFIMRALNFLVGEKLSPDMVRPGSDKASVEALFAVQGREMVLRREVSAETGRSRVFLDDRLSSQEAVRELAPSLVLHTSQHSQQKLLSPAYQARVLDAFMIRSGPGPEGQLARRDTLLADLRALAEERRDLEERVAGLESRRELLAYQQGLIDQVNPEPGEERELMERKRAHADRARTANSVEAALSLLHGEGEGLLSVMDRLAAEVARLADLLPGSENSRAEEVGYRAEAVALVDMKERLRDLDSRLRREGGMDEGYDLEAVESRLFELSKLQRKLGRSLEDVLDLRQEIAQGLSLLDSCALDRSRLDQREAQLVKDLQSLLKSLNAARHVAADTLCQALERDLRGLGFSDQARVQFDFEPREVHPGCLEDRARLLWVPNPGQPPQPLDRIASGGELSRFTLALAGLMSRDELPTLVFDEVDAGIGGLTLNRVADRLADLASRQQVLLITHWPLLAARAGWHFHVSKESDGDRTAIRCASLSGEAVVLELARMAGGGSQGEALARDLLAG